MAYCYFHGGIIDEKEASLSIHTMGVHRGFGVFDFFRMRNGEYCFIDDHLARFEKSQQFMQLSEMISKDEIREALDMLKDWNGYKDAGFKLILLGDGSESDVALKPLFYITQVDLSGHKPPPLASVILHDYQREYPHIKTINYFTSNLLHRKRVSAGAIDVIYHHEGIVSEASRSNVFIVKDGQIFTPKSGILEGVTRKHVMMLAQHFTQVEQTNISLEDFRNADEIFITSTLKEVLPIVEVEGRKIGDGREGTITRKIQRSFFELFY